MENVFNNQKQSFKDQNDMLEVVDDLFSTKQQTLSNSSTDFVSTFHKASLSDMFSGSRINL